MDVQKRGIQILKLCEKALNKHWLFNPLRLSIFDYHQPKNPAELYSSNIAPTDLPFGADRAHYVEIKVANYQHVFLLHSLTATNASPHASAFKMSLRPVT